MILTTQDKLLLVQGSPKPLLQGLSRLGAAVPQDAGVQTDAGIGHRLPGPVPVLPEGWDVHNDDNQAEEI